jgi:hypothetical protein
MGLDPQDPSGELTDPEPPDAVPSVVDVPYVSQTGDTLNSTMGNWTGEPTAYTYTWHIDGTPSGADSAVYTVDAAEVGKTATCVVTAANALGSTTAPPSNEVVIVG